MTAAWKPTRAQRRKQREIDQALASARNNKGIQRATAYHEGSHAIFSELLDYPVEYVSILPTMERDGIRYGISKMIGDPLLNGGVMELGLARIISAIMILLAGSYAEHRIGTMRVGMVCESDLKPLGEKIVQIVSGADMSPLQMFELCQVSTLQFLGHADVWAAITELAELLLVRKKVDGATVREIARRRASSMFVSEAAQLKSTVAMSEYFGGEQPPELFAEAIRAAEAKAGLNIVAGSLPAFSLAEMEAPA